VTVGSAAFGQNVWGAFMKRFMGFSHEKVLKSMGKVFGVYLTIQFSENNSHLVSSSDQISDFQVSKKIFRKYVDITGFWELQDNWNKGK